MTAQRIRAEANKRGIDAEAALAEAERLSAAPPDKAASSSGDPAPSSSEPAPLLIGHLPFVLVRELRKRLGLTEAFPDDGLPCGVWQRKHESGGAAAAPAVEVAP